MSGLATTTRWVYPFEDGSAEMRELLGNKGANLAEMTRVLGAEKVPGGFTITTAACVEYMRNAGRLPAGLDDQIAGAVGELERANGEAVRRSRRPAAALRALRARRYRCPACSTPS